MSEQQRASAPADQQTEETVDPAPAAPPAEGQAGAQASTAGVDSLLDEIDGVLEANAEEFVRGFVQKGGQ